MTIPQNFCQNVPLLKAAQNIANITDKKVAIPHKYPKIEEDVSLSKFINDKKEINYIIINFKII